jgi:O-antigen/teichoic acid export membrane protein
MKRENYRHTLTVAYLTTGLSQSFELAYNYLFFNFLSIQQIGLYSWVLALVMFFNVAVNMGIEPVLVRKFGQGEFRLMRAFQAILLLRVPVIVLGIALTAILYTSEILSSTQFFVILLMGAQVIFNVCDGVFKSWLLANNRQNIVNIINVLFSGLKLGYIGIMFSFSWNSLYYLLAGILIFRLMGSAIIYFRAYTLSLGNEIVASADVPPVQIAGDLFRAGLSIGGINVLGIIQNRLDWLLVSGMISTLVLASYSLANKLYEIFQLIIGVSLQTIYPWLCRNEENERKALLLFVRLVIVFGALLGLCGIFVSPALIKLIFGNKFSEAELPIMILMLSASIIAASGVFYHLALSKGLESKLLLITTITTTLQFAANLILIPKLGITGAALGMLVLAITTLTGLTILVQVETLVPRAVIRRILIFLSASIFYVALLLYFKAAVWFAAAIVLIAIAGTGWITLFDPPERKHLLNVVNGFTHHFMISIKEISFTGHFR